MSSSTSYVYSNKFYDPVAHKYIQHNYARWNGGIIGQGGPTNDQYASLWTQLTAQYGTNTKVIFGLMNEPHDIPDLQTWATSLQYVVNAIRTAGGQNYLLLPGSSYSSAQTLPTEAGPYLLPITDPLGGTSKLIFDGTYFLISALCWSSYLYSAQVPR